MKPYWTTKDGNSVRLFHGDVLYVLKQLPEKSVQVCVTSPPYYALRDYGTGEWEGGLATCEHDAGKAEKRTRETYNNSGNYTSAFKDKVERGLAHFGNVCRKCGAQRIDKQIGSERTPGEFVAKMVEVFKEVRRVLRDDGCLWLNLGSTYGENGNLVPIPWVVALALQKDGWILRQDIIWAKPSPMPEPVTNRCTKAHEYVFLLTKQMGYYYDAEAIREPHTDPKRGEVLSEESSNPHTCGGTKTSIPTWVPGKRQYHPNGRNKRSVWTISSEPYSGAHFAAFPRKLVEPCILAGSSAYGCCADCGAPWKRIVDKVQLKRERPQDYTKRTGQEGTGNSCGNTVAGVETKTIGWRPTCCCHGKLLKKKVKVAKQVVDDQGSEKKNTLQDVGLRSNKSTLTNPSKAKTHEEYVEEYVSQLPLDQHPVRPCIVLDPFIGTATTAEVAIRHGRWCWGIDLSEKYLKENAIPRIESTGIGQGLELENCGVVRFTGDE